MNARVHICLSLIDEKGASALQITNVFRINKLPRYTYHIRGVHIKT